jgi:threonine dehydratase
MELLTIDQIHDAQSLIYRYMPATPQYTWPLVNLRLGAEAWIKHENHTPVGAFKLRGALVFLAWLKDEQPELEGVVAATRGNFGQGVGMAARLFGLKCVIVVPHGNSQEKNRAMQAQGVELITQGNDFQESLEFARALAVKRRFAFIDSFHERLVLGTATYALEYLEGSPELDLVYVPIGMGSSICGMAAARNALGLKTEIVGVTAEAAPAIANSFREGVVLEAPAQTAIADGLACRRPNPEALAVMLENVSRIVQVSDEEILEAMRALHEDTHNLAEGAGAASMAAALKEKTMLHKKRVGILLTGGNVDREIYRGVLNANEDRMVSN